MTRAEFTPMMRFLAASVGVQVAEETVIAYYGMLNDIPLEVLLNAAKLAVLENTYGKIPPINRLRELSVQIMGGFPPTVSEAWTQIAEGVRRFSESREREMLGALHPLVRRAALAFGIQRFRDCPVSQTQSLFAQFRDFYQSMADRPRREALAPPAVREAIAGIGIIPDGKQLEDRRSG
ncbi:MAG: hypothetical protein KGL39_26935 [Patescibacteria group bacterium]|nr:hypothetical protein [Patescibacteria group bacterium]